MARPKPNAAERGRAAWPKLKLDEADFLKWLGPRADDEKVHVEDLWLTRACLEQVPGAVATFQRELMGPALAALPPNDRDDVGQRVLERLLAGESPKLAEFEGRGSLARWLRMVVLREARTERVVAQREAPLLAERLSGAFMPGPDSALVKVRSQAALKKALVAALLSLDEEERKLLAMHHLDGVPHGEIGKAVKTPRSTVAWRLDKARQKVLEATKRNLRESGLQQKEIDSLFGVLRSQVDISLSVLKS
jgi:RNA polymerase sigma-70 factor (ECF subfamily)